MDRRHPFASRLLSFTVLLTFFGSANAFAEERFVGPVATATGGAGLATVDAGEASQLNPAAVSFLGRMLISTNYMLYDHPTDPDQKQFGVFVSDGTMDKILAGSFSYLHRTLRGHDGSDALEQHYRLSLAQFAVGKVSVGVSGNYFSYKQRTVPANYYQTNFDLGILYSPIQQIGVAFVANNLLKGAVDIPEGIRTVPSLGLGFHGILKEAFRFRFDLVRPDSLNPGHRIDVRTGLESLVMPELAFRLGMNFKEVENQTLVTGGFGYLGPRLSFNYAYEKDIRESAGSRHIVDLWLPF